MSRPKHAAVVHPRRSTPYLLLATAALVLLPATPAFAHSEATYTGHGSTGTLHVQYFVYHYTTSTGRQRHMVQLAHPFDSTPDYDSLAVSHRH